MLGSGLLALAAAGGISRLDVENSFLDYFAEDTEIYRGMSYVDQKLGGTTPFDVLIDFPTLAPAVDDPFAAPAADPFGDPFGDLCRSLCRTPGRQRRCGAWPFDDAGL